MGGIEYTKIGQLPCQSIVHFQNEPPKIVYIYTSWLLYSSDLDIDGIGPGLGLQTDPTVSAQELPIPPSVGPIQEVARVQLHPRLV